VSNYYHGTLTVVDAVADTIITSLAVGWHPGQASVSHALNRIYVPVWGGDVVVVDGEQDVVEDQVYVFGGICEPELTWFDQTSGWLYVAPFNCPFLAVLDGKTLAFMTGGLVLPGYPTAVFGNEEIGQAYVVAETTLAVVSPELVVIQCVELGSYHSSRGVCHPPSGRLFVKGSIPWPPQDHAVLVIEEESAGVTMPGAAEEIGLADVGTPSMRCVPNPFRHSAVISCQLPAPGPVSLRVFDVTGAMVRVLLEEPAAPDGCQVVWDGRDDRGEALPAGVYFYRLMTPDLSRRGKALLIR